MLTKKIKNKEIVNKKKGYKTLKRIDRNTIERKYYTYFYFNTSVVGKGVNYVENLKERTGLLIELITMRDIIALLVDHKALILIRFNKNRYNKSNIISTLKE